MAGTLHCSILLNMILSVFYSTLRFFIITYFRRFFFTFGPDPKLPISVALPYGHESLIAWFWRLNTILVDFRSWLGLKITSFIFLIIPLKILYSNYFIIHLVLLQIQDIFLDLFPYSFGYLFSLLTS